MKASLLWLVSSTLLLAFMAGVHSSSVTTPSLSKEVSVTDLEAPLVMARTLPSTATTPTAASTMGASLAQAVSTVDPIAMAETQSQVTTSTATATSTGTSTSTSTSTGTGSALHRVSQAWITASLAQMEKERYEEEIRRQVEKEDEDWNALEKQQLPEGTTVALELDSTAAGQAVAEREFISMNARTAESQQLQTEQQAAEHPIKRVNLMRLPERHPLRNQPRFAETLARADSQFKHRAHQTHRRHSVVRSKVRGKHRAKIGEKIKVIRKVIIKKVPVPIPVPVRASEDDNSEEAEDSDNDNEGGVGKYAQHMRFAERAKVGAATQAEARQRVHGGSGAFTRRAARRAEVEAEAETESQGALGKKPKAQAVEDCTGCQFIWKQVEMDVGSGRFVEDVQASFEHNCMDAQKSTIFYGVCEDMYDDMYALTDDYMSNQYDVKKMCKRAKMC